MKKIFVLGLIFLAILFQFCSSSKKAHRGENNVAKLTYSNNIQNVIVTNCSPCHITGKGNKKPLDSYEAVSANIDDIIARVKKNPEERGFMPFKHPKLDDATIQMLVTWKDQGNLK